MAGISFDDLIPKNGAQPETAPGISFDDLIPKANNPGQYLSYEDGLALLDQEAATGGAVGAVDAFGRGAANGATFGFADELGAGARWLGGKMLPWQPNVTYDQALDEVRGSDRALAEKHPVADMAGNLTGAVGAGAGIVKAGVSPTAHAINAGRGLGTVSFASGAEGAALGALQGFGQTDGGMMDRAAEAGYGGAGGLAIGAAIPGVMSVAGSAVRRAVSPFLTNPERTRAADYLADEGVGLTAGQRTGNRSLQYAESELGGQRGADMMERQGEQFTSAALRRAGMDANRATPETIDGGFRSISEQFDDLASRNEILPDTQLAQDLGTTVREYFSMVPESARAPVVMDMARDLGRTLGQGPLNGAAYQAARSRLDKAARSSALDPQLQQALYGLRNSLDDGMERSIAATNPADAGAWREARRQYRNMLVIEKAITGAGEDAAQGIISPSKLRGATAAQSRRNYARGRGDLAELARSGEATMKPLPNSGTAGRINAQNMGSGIASMMGMGSAGYASGGDPATMLAGGAAGFALPRVAGRMLMSGPVQTYLGNQAAQGVRMSPQKQAILNMLLNIEGSEGAPSVGRALVGR
jgi:hypothetical protein